MAAQSLQLVASKDGTRIAYSVSGSGPRLVVVSGAMGHRALSFARQMTEGLSQRFTVVDYDRRGRGESGDAQPYAVAREVEDLAAVVAGPGQGDCHVVGLSSGAALALEAAASGVPMKGLVAYEPPYMVGSDPTGKPDADYLQKMQALVAAGKRDEAVSYFMRTVGVPGPMLFVMRLMPFWKDAKAVAHTLPYDGAVMGDFSLPAARLKKVRAPTVLMNGSKSPRTLQEGTAAAAAAIPGARHVVLPKQTHAVKPAALASALAAAFKDPN
jgi:pimeloyl-ACP methyl ester carboxylesterase